MRKISWAVLISTAALAGCGDDETAAGTTGPDPSTQIAEAKAALTPYADLSAALADGYFSTVEYVATPDGGMGIHFANMSIVEVDHTKPNVLMYDLKDDGTYELLGAEWITPTAAATTAPELFGETFSGPHPAEGDLLPEHYALHAWFVKDNPNGMFADFNPDVTGPSFLADMQTTLGAVATYADSAAAISAGYVDTMECVSSPDGGMGVHFVNDTIMGVSADQPHVLMYEPDGSGGLELIGVEWFVPSAAVTSAPELFGQTFEGPMPGHDANQPEHYELHMWLHRANPAGMFAGFNTSVSCP
jgi:hypothetical protein